MSTRREAVAGRSTGTNRAGVTLIELLAVIVLTGVVAAIALGTWQRLSTYVFARENHAQLRNATDRIATALSNELRRSHSLLLAENERISFVSANGDTITYRLEWDGVFLRDARPVYIGVLHAHVTEFNITTTGNGVFGQGGEDGMVHISLVLADTVRGTTAGADVEVAVRLPEDPLGWGF